MDWSAMLLANKDQHHGCCLHPPLAVSCIPPLARFATAAIAKTITIENNAHFSEPIFPTFFGRKMFILSLAYKV